MPGKSITAGTIQSLAKGLEVLEVIARRDQPASLSDLAREMSMSKSGMYRVLATLCECKYVTQDAASSHYSLTNHMLQVGQQYERSLDLRMTARSHLSRLRDLTGETAHLAIPVGTQMVYVDKFESAHSLRMASSIGQRIELHCTSLGKCYLAFADGGRVSDLLATIDMPGKTSATITSPVQLRAELDRTRARGYSIDDIENEEGVRCVGAPVLDRDGLVIACISVSGPASRLSRAIVDQIGTACREAADAINHALGSPTTGDIAHEREHEAR